MAAQHRIVSFLPAATEMVAALGLIDQLVGVSAECDWPASAAHFPAVVHPAVNAMAMTPGEIEYIVGDRVRSGESLYVVDEAKLAALKPSLILTQDLCQVCAPSGNELSRLLPKLDPMPGVIYMSPRRVSDIFENVRALAQVTVTEEKAEALIHDWKERVEAVKGAAARQVKKPRVFVMEWVEPLYASGHWLAEMTHMAGGYDKLGRPGQDSIRVTWDEVRRFAPEVLIVAPCGYNLTQASRHAAMLARLPGWSELPAVRDGRVYAVDANAYLVRPGPRVIDGLELLYTLFHAPDMLARFSTACQRVENFTAA